ncbi:MAG: M14 family metallopeptidase, partial [Candidatus Kapaibacteriota bacterium]
MKKLTLLFVLLTNFFAFSKYSLVEIHLLDITDYKRFENLNLDLESVVFDKNRLIVIVNDFEREELRNNDLMFSVLIDDYEEYLANQILQRENKIAGGFPHGFELGSMGGFYTYEEIFIQINKLTTNNTFFVESDTIGYSWENKPLIAYCFGSKDTTKPELLITALHHSREPATITSLLFFLKTFLEKAKNEDPEALYLLNNRRIWVIPVLNPDGYLYNQIRYPKGGGLWRKNRRPINQSDTGVDLNRNYGPYEFWNANNNGSSTNPKNETYRGPAPFSEPELKALRNFCFRRNFLLAVNLHTYGGMLIYPYSALSTETPDSSWYRSYGMYVQQLNSYYFGTDRQTVGYPTRGSSDDWFYTPDSTKGKVFAFSPELSYQFDGFWPDASRILKIATENYKLFLEFIWSVEENIKIVDHLYNFDTTKKIGYLHLTFQNLGISSTNEKITVRVFSIDNSYKFDSVFQIENLLTSEKITKILPLPLP